MRSKLDSLVRIMTYELTEAQALDHQRRDPGIMIDADHHESRITFLRVSRRPGVPQVERSSLAPTALPG